MCRTPEITCRSSARHACGWFPGNSGPITTHTVSSRQNGSCIAGATLLSVDATLE
ncbi:hypothetical protein SH611_12220 [Geminicoccaceae bacterium 1502E]|nr:hypothetical protein [Geminicoccaceae bacterium 1502E]